MSEARPVFQPFQSLIDVFAPIISVYIANRASRLVLNPNKKIFANPGYVLLGLCEVDENHPGVIVSESDNVFGSIVGPGVDVADIRVDQLKFGSGLILIEVVRLPGKMTLDAWNTFGLRWFC